MSVRISLLKMKLTTHQTIIYIYIYIAGFVLFLLNYFRVTVSVRVNLRRSLRTFQYLNLSSHIVFSCDKILPFLASTVNHSRFENTQQTRAVTYQNVAVAFHR